MWCEFNITNNIFSLKSQIKMPRKQKCVSRNIGNSDKVNNKLPREIEMLKDYFQDTFYNDCILWSLEYSKSLLLMLLLIQMHHQHYQLILWKNVI